MTTTPINDDVFTEILINSVKRDGERFANSKSEFDDDNYQKVNDNHYYDSENDEIILIHSFHQIDEIEYGDEIDDGDKQMMIESFIEFIRDENNISGDYSNFELERRCIKFDNCFGSDYYNAYGIGVIKLKR